MIYLSAGHWNGDPGAVSGKYTEAKLMMAWRDELAAYIRSKGYTVITDKDSESLSQYLGRIKPGNASVVVEYHLNAAGTPEARGTEVVVANNYSAESYKLAKKLAYATSTILNIPLRGRNKDGVITENDTARKSLALMRKDGTVVLPELVFITNPSEVAKLLDPKLRTLLIKAHGDLIIEAENAIK